MPNTKDIAEPGQEIMKAIDGRNIILVQSSCRFRDRLKWFPGLRDLHVGLGASHSTSEKYLPIYLYYIAKRVRDPAYWLSLADGESSCNLVYAYS